MKLTTIFADSIWSVIYEESIDDAYNDEFEHWHDVEYIFDFVISHEKEWRLSPWKNLSIENMTLTVMEEADELESRLIDTYEYRSTTSCGAYG